MRGIIRDLHLCLFRDRGKIENINLKCVIKANVISQIMKLMKFIETSFARLIKEIFIIYERLKQKKHIIKTISNS